ncbi:MAG TPA: glycosyltransferase 87 family protein [Candidatus Dormibacteraeota bacterium]|nr:glycosyltransferase 87 family protein [Candidatus Dormibacteraeota bacterium]
MAKRGEPAILLLFGLPTAAIDWQIAESWRLPAWVSLLAAAVVIVAFGAVLLLPRLRAVGSAIMAAVLYGMPVIGGIARWKLIPSPKALIGDGAYQMQLARGVLMRGIDPYGFNYAGTGMERAPWSQPFANPSLHHLDYWPGTIVLPLPVQAAFRAVFGWWDERLWLLLVAAVIWIVIGRLAPGPVGRMAALAFFLIPGHSLLAVLGDNDLPMVALLLAGMLAIHRERWLLAGGLIGLAIATKQTALIAVPVVLCWSVARGIGWHRLLQACGLGAAVIAVLFTPFLIWNAHAFISDTIVFNLGGGTETYPIQGIGLSAWLLQIGFIHDAREAFPFFLIQLPLVVAAWVMAGRWFAQRRAIGDAIFWIGIALFVFLFTNRFSQQAYLLLGAELILAGLIARLWRQPDIVAEAPVPVAA